jgi:hypothetical protein
MSPLECFVLMECQLLENPARDTPMQQTLQWKSAGVIRGA